MNRFWSPWQADSAGGYQGIRHGVSRARNFVKWRTYAGVLGRSIGGVVGGGVGAAVGAGALAYQAYQAYKQYKSQPMAYRRRKPSKTAARLAVLRKARPNWSGWKKQRKNGRSYRRKKSGGGRRRLTSSGSKRTADYSAGGSGGRGGVVDSKRRRTTAMVGSAEYGRTMYVKCAVGKGRRFDRRTLKNMDQSITRWQRVNTMTSAAAIPGAISMLHGTNGTATDCPMYFMRLNQTNGNGTYSEGPFYRVQFLDNGAINPVTVVSQNSAAVDAADGDWQFEKDISGTMGLGTGLANRYITTSWYDIRFMLYGCTAAPTEFDISVVSFKRGYLDFLENPSNAQEAQDRHALYQGMVQPYMSNPIMPRIRSVNGLRVHKSVRVKFDPTQTTENDTDPKCMQVRLFIKDGNTYDYRYFEDGFQVASADNNLSTVKWVTNPTATADFVNIPGPMARKYLVIRALNPQRAVPTVANTPSFDIIVRKKEIYNSERI